MAIKNPGLADLIAKVSEALETAYHRGESDAIKRIVTAAQGGGYAVLTSGQTATSVLGQMEKPRTRSARGLPEAFAKRTLQAAGVNGITPTEAARAPITQAEEQVSYSALRGAFSAGLTAGWAKYEGGRFYWNEEEKN